jgi:CBS domain-containing protein
MSAMPVSKLIGDDVIRVAPDADLFAVADALTANDVGVLAVSDSTRIDAIVSERDVVHALAARRAPETTRAIDISNTTLVWCDASASIGEVASEMMDHYVRHVLVESRGRLLGIVSARDLLGAYAATDSGTMV